MLPYPTGMLRYRVLRYPYRMLRYRYRYRVVGGQQSVIGLGAISLEMPIGLM